MTIRCSAEGLYNGIYGGTLTIQSNDPDAPFLDLPMMLEMRKGLEVNFVHESEPNNNETEAQKLLGPAPSGIKGDISISDVGNISIQNDDIEDLTVFTTQSLALKLIYLIFLLNWTSF